ncbi:MAG TPA: calcium/sodium antiporter, partial [Candidatus Omnitrophota bacterium]|nr:calcium/sodium antiporter [Candidatus Omnitrophota bacterium]
LVRGAVGVARRAGVSELAIGLTLVGAMTSAPEMVVSVQAALAGQAGLALGNVVGSNTANLLLIMGAGGLVRPLVAKRAMMLRDGGINLASGLLLAGLALDGAFQRYDGLLLTACLISYIAWTYRAEHRVRRQNIHVKEARELETPVMPLWVAGLATGGGLVALVWGADLLVEGAVGIARRAGVSEAVVGLSIVAVGTSLPELATSVVAAWRRHTDVAVGNAVGSCLFNTFGIVGVSSALAPYAADPEVTRLDLPVMLAVSAGVMALLAWRQKLGRVESALFVALYAAYAVWLFGR